jgi:indole-3-glycerol phosphate synthase
VPVLRKDFIIDEYQIIESRANGADAVLLLANVLNLKDMQKFLDLSRGLGLKCLVETHTEDEIKMVLDTDAEIIGINNRDLKTFKVDIGNTERLIKMIPKEKVIISESGISNKNDVKYIQDLGVDGMLVGGSIMSEKNVEDKIVELLKND